MLSSSLSFSLTNQAKLTMRTFVSSNAALHLALHNILTKISGCSAKPGNTCPSVAKAGRLGKRRYLLVFESMVALLRKQTFNAEDGVILLLMNTAPSMRKCPVHAVLTAMATLWRGGCKKVVSNRWIREGDESFQQGWQQSWIFTLAEE